MGIELTDMFIDAEAAQAVDEGRDSQAELTALIETAICATCPASGWPSCSRSKCG